MGDCITDLEAQKDKRTAKLRPIHLSCIQIITAKANWCTDTYTKNSFHCLGTLNTKLDTRSIRSKYLLCFFAKLKDPLANIVSVKQHLQRLKG